MPFLLKILDIAKRRYDLPYRLEELIKQEKVCPFKFKAFLGKASHVTLFAYFV